MLPLSLFPVDMEGWELGVILADKRRVAYLSRDYFIQSY